MQKKQVLLLILLMTLLSIVSSSLIPAGVQAQPDDPPASALTPTTDLEVISPYFSIQHSVTADGTALSAYIINGPPEPPPGFEAERAASIQPLPSRGVLASFPSYDWVFGCSAVSGAMIAAYHDRNGYSAMYSGPTDGGVMPLTDTSWAGWNDVKGDPYPNNPLIASHLGVDGRATRGSIDDYWVSYFSDANDPYITGHWTQHGWGTAIGDFMKTSQSAYENLDGSTFFYNYTNSGAPLTCADMESYSIDEFDGTYGRKLFYEARGYTVEDCYSRNTDNNWSGGFSLADFRAEIDAGNPVLLNLEGHSIVGYGYSGSTIYIRDTWSSNPAETPTMTWGGSYSGLELLSVSIVKLAPVSTAMPVLISPAGAILDPTPTHIWNDLTNATQYQFQLYDAAGDTLLHEEVIVTPASICDGSHCTFTPGALLSQGAYNWRVRAYMEGAWGGWSASMSFNVTAPTLISPSGAILDPTPTHVWNDLTNATQFQFQLYDAADDTLLHEEVIVTPASICDGSHCMLPSGVSLLQGAYNWRVRAYEGEWGVWSALLGFSVTAPIPIAPVGTSYDSTPIYQWTGHPSATQYLIQLNRSDDSLVYENVVTTDSCDPYSDACSATFGTVLEDGDYWWQIRAYVDGSWGIWSEGSSFNLSKAVIFLPLVTFVEMVFQAP